MNAERKAALLQELKPGPEKAAVKGVEQGQANDVKETSKDDGQKKEGFVKETFKAILTDPIVKGEARRGLKDLQDAILVAFPESMKSRDEPGTIANPTQMIVTEEIKGKVTNHSHDEPRAQENAQSPERTKQKEVERE